MLTRLTVLASAAIYLAGCSSSEVIVAHSVGLVPSSELIAESELLDVGVVVFDPGVPEGEIATELLEELIEDGTFVQIRRTEARYFAVELRDTLRRSNYWGSVWITPEATLAADINVVAEILQSDGEIVAVNVNAVDASGQVWIDEEYRISIANGAYNRFLHDGLDPYQDLFNEIANDLAAVRRQLAADEAERLRSIAALRYASDLSPDAFSDYVVADRGGVYSLNRLPAVGDPQFNRTQRARQREHLFFETLSEHYVRFAREASDSYDSWRQYSREESIQIREITRSARFRTGMGIASIVASFVYGNNSSNNSFSDRVIRDTLMYIGTDMLRTSATRRQEKRLHVETLEELSSSFDDEVEPLVVSIQGTEHRLTGTADIQYQEWKDLLRELYISETGFTPEDIEIYVEPDPVIPEDAADTTAETTADSTAGDVDPTATVPANQDSNGSESEQQTTESLGGALIDA